MNKIDVVPTKASAEQLRHPVDGLLGKGACWRLDTFTARRLSDGSIARASAVASVTGFEASTPTPTAAPAPEAATHADGTPAA